MRPAQALELLRLLLDPDMMEGPVEKNSFLELFYSTYMSRVLELLTAGGAAEEVGSGLLDYKLKSETKSQQSLCTITLLLLPLLLLLWPWCILTAPPCRASISEGNAASGVLAIRSCDQCRGATSALKPLLPPGPLPL